MKSPLRIAWVCLALACAPPYEEPPPLERELGDEQGDPPPRSSPPYVHDAGVFVLPDAGCCPVRFALAHGGEVAVSLFGFGPPLRPDVPLVRDGGVWEAVVCMRPTTHVYGYRAYVLPDLGDAGLFEQVTYNPNAPTTSSVEYGLLNELRAPEDAGSSCDFDTAAHGDTTIPDAGGDPDGGNPDGGA